MKISAQKTRNTAFQRKDPIRAEIVRDNVGTNLHFTYLSTDITYRTGKSRIR